MPFAGASLAGCDAPPKEKLVEGAAGAPPNENGVVGAGVEPAPNWKPDVPEEAPKSKDGG